MTVFLDGITEVIVEHSTKARRMSITVQPSRVRVAVPSAMPLSLGREFALARRDWIRSHLERMGSLHRTWVETMTGLPSLDDPAAARQKIIKRLKELSERYAMPYRRVSVRRQRTRWGSCGMHGSISLNINLARLPSELMDYVILHELLHTRIRGHGREFWQRLDMLVGDARALRKELGRYSIMLE